VHLVGYLKRKLSISIKKQKIFFIFVFQKSKSGSFNSGRLIIPCKVLISQQFQLVSTNNTQFSVALLMYYYFE